MELGPVRVLPVPEDMSNIIEMVKWKIVTNWSEPDSFSRDLDP